MFLLTGSANVLLLPKVSESLLGRMDIIVMSPLSQSEIAGTQPTFIADEQSSDQLHLLPDHLRQSDSRFIKL